MSETTTQAPNAGAIIQSKSEVEYVPFGADDRLRLTLNIVRDYIAVPTSTGELPDQRDCMRFMMLCRSQRLNPFAGDAFLIGFKRRDEAKANWSLITAHAAFLKRAEIHPEFDGFRSGVIVKTPDEEIMEREGDIVYEGETLLGGWCVVEFKKRKVPMRRRAKLQTYSKPFGNWTIDPAGMIVKVAEAQALRDSFPTLLGGMMLREESHDTDNEQPVAETRRPEFTKSLPAVASESFVPGAPRATKPQKPQDAPKEKAAVPTPPEAKTPQAAPAAPQPAPVKEQTAPAKPAPEPEDNHSQVPESEPEPEPEQSHASDTGDPEVPVPSLPDPALADNQYDTPASKNIKYLARTTDVSFMQLWTWLKAVGLAKSGQSALHELSQTKLEKLGSVWHEKLPELKKQPKG